MAWRRPRARSTLRRFIPEKLPCCWSVAAWPLTSILGNRSCIALPPASMQSSPQRGEEAEASVDDDLVGLVAQVVVGGHHLAVGTGLRDQDHVALLRLLQSAVGAQHV